MDRQLIFASRILSVKNLSGTHGNARETLRGYEESPSTRGGQFGTGPNAHAGDRDGPESAEQQFWGGRGAGAGWGSVGASAGRAGCAGSGAQSTTVDISFQTQVQRQGVSSFALVAVGVFTPQKLARGAVRASVSGEPARGVTAAGRARVRGAGAAPLRVSPTVCGPPRQGRDSRPRDGAGARPPASEAVSLVSLAGQRPSGKQGGSRGSK